MALVELGQYWNSFEAGLVQSKLLDEGIESVLFDFDMANYAGTLMIPIRVMVDDEDAARARRIIA
jgi:hypothetical protein